MRDLEHGCEIFHLFKYVLSNYKVLGFRYTSVNKADMGFVLMGLTV